MELENNIRIGKARVNPATSSHSPGVFEGNKRQNIQREPGIERAGRFMTKATARRSTGINPRAHEPIDARMPVLTPA